MDQILTSLLGGIPSAVLIGFVGNSFIKKFSKMEDQIIHQDKEIALLKKEIEYLSKATTIACTPK